MNCLCTTILAPLSIPPSCWNVAMVLVESTSVHLHLLVNEPLNLFVGQALTFKVLWTCVTIKEWVTKHIPACLRRELTHKFYRNCLETLPDCSMKLLLALLFIEWNVPIGFLGVAPCIFNTSPANSQCYFTETRILTKKSPTVERSSASFSRADFSFLKSGHCSTSSYTFCVHLQSLLWYSCPHPAIPFSSLWPRILSCCQDQSSRVG